MKKHFWYFSRHIPKADIVFSKKNSTIFGYTERPSYAFIEKYNLRFLDYDTLGKVVGKLD